MKEAYNLVFDQFEQLCKENGVAATILPSRDATIANACASQSIDKLKNSIDTTEFFNKWVNTIMERAESGKRKPIKFSRFAEGHPRTIKNAAEIDDYLQGLRQRMLTALENNDLII